MRAQTDEAGTWLCPTEFDRERLLDMEERLQGARAVMFGALGVGFAISVPWIGWWPVALVVVQVAAYRLLKPAIAASEQPERWIAFIVVLAQVQIAAAVALTGGPQSPLLLVFLLGIVGLPARFGTTRVVAAGVVLTEVLILAATAGADPGSFGAHPAPAIVTAAASFGLVAFAHTLMRAESQKRSDSVVDSLTGLPNRRSLEASVENLIADAHASATPIALLLCDLDLFKSINDLHGHQRGDTVLIETAQAIHRSLRPTEQVYRLGGEEFLVLISDCDVDRGLLVAERVRSAIEAAQPGGLDVTASVGLSTATGQDIDFDELFRTADAGLYEAKHAGRNRVAHATAVAA